MNVFTEILTALASLCTIVQLVLLIKTESRKPSPAEAGAAPGTQPRRWWWQTLWGLWGTYSFVLYFYSLLMVFSPEAAEFLETKKVPREDAIAAFMFLPVFPWFAMAYATWERTQTLFNVYHLVFGVWWALTVVAAVRSLIKHWPSIIKKIATGFAPDWKRVTPGCCLHCLGKGTCTTDRDDSCSCAACCTKHGVAIWSEEEDTDSEGKPIKLTRRLWTRVPCAICGGTGKLKTDDPHGEETHAGAKRG